MLTFVVRRLISLPLVMLAVTVMVVGLMQFLSPQERAVSFVTNERQMQNLDRIIKERGLDKPFYVQYASWIGNAFTGNLGFSKASNRPVVDTILERFPATAELALLACIPIIGLGIWLGTLTALHKDKLLDQVLRILTVIGYCLPTFVVGILLLIVFYGALGWLPGIGRNDPVLMITNPVKTVTGMIIIDSVLAGNWIVLGDALRHMILPIITLATVSSATMIKVMRAELLDILKSDYVRTAKAKGLPNQMVNMKHARRNALLPIVTLASFTVQGLLSGAVITETIFGYPGIGSWGAEAALKLDYPGVLGFAILIAFVTVLSNLTADLLYGLVDPRVRFD